MGPGVARRAASLLAVAGLVLAPQTKSGHAEIRSVVRETLATRDSAPPRSFGRLRLPLLFIENRGQVDPTVSHYVPGRGMTAYFTGEGVTWALDRGGRRWAVKQDFLGARPGARPEARDRRETVFSWFRGPRDRWKTGLPSFGTLAYPGLWPGIDMVCSAERDRLKTLFVVAPDADPGRIRFAYRGATTVRATDTGSLAVETPVGSFEDAAPAAFQERDGRRIEVPVSYGLECGTDGAVACGFRLGDFDPALPLLLDPSVALYAGYIGGSGTDYAAGVAVDAAGNAYVAGTTDSTAATFPVTAGPVLALFAPPPTIYGTYGRDAFVAKVRADGTGLVYCGYIGGGGYYEEATGIAVDSSGCAYVAGTTDSWEGTFPVVVGPDLTFNGYESDAFVAKVSADGTDLVYCGYVGGGGSDTASDIAVDTAGSAFVTGNTSSTEATFPVAVGPDLTFNGGLDAFVAKVRADGTGLDYCGYIGGADDDEGRGIVVDAAGRACITGWTVSSEASFPATVGPDLSYNDGPTYDPGGDAFVAKVSTDGTGLAYCGYIGGMWEDSASAVAVDSLGNAYVTGSTWSREDTFPVVAGPSLVYSGGPRDTIDDAFVAKVRADGTGLDYCGYIGGTGDDAGLAIAVDVAGNAFVAGITDSTEATFPLFAGPVLTATERRYHWPIYGTTRDAFVARIPPDGGGFDFCGYLGVEVYGYGLGIAVDGAGSVFVVGDTASEASALPATVGPRVTAGGDLEGFVARLPAAYPPPPRSLRILTERGAFRRTSFYWRDHLSLDGTYEVEGEPFPDGMDPRSGELVLDVAAPWSTARLRIPPGDPGWKATREGVFTWRSPLRSVPSWRIRVDTGAGSFSARCSKASLAYEGWEPVVTVHLSAIGASGSDTRTWRRRGWRVLSLPRGSGE